MSQEHTPGSRDAGDLHRGGAELCSSPQRGQAKLDEDVGISVLWKDML